MQIAATGCAGAAHRRRPLPHGTRRSAAPADTTFRACIRQPFASTKLQLSTLGGTAGCYRSSTTDSPSFVACEIAGAASVCNGTHLGAVNRLTDTQKPRVVIQPFQPSRRRLTSFALPVILCVELRLRGGTQSLPDWKHAQHLSPHPTAPHHRPCRVTSAADDGQSTA